MTTPSALIDTRWYLPVICAGEVCCCLLLATYGERKCTVECSIIPDLLAWRTCYTCLQVQAVDAAGNVERTGPVLRWNEQYAANGV
jgi:hypothetical protein